VGFVVFVPFFLLGGMGAGDVKLLAAFGAWLGPGGSSGRGFGGVAGGVLAVLVALDMATFSKRFAIWAPYSGTGGRLV